MAYEYKPRTRAKYLADPIFKGMSLRQLEREAGVPRVQIARLLKGESSPKHIIEAVSRAIDCDSHQLQDVLVRDYH